MAPSKSFILYLPSDVDTGGAHNNNSPCCYTTILQDELYFEHLDRWKVCLREVVFPKTVRNITGKNKRVTINYVSPVRGSKFTVIIPSGVYTPTSYANAFNHELENAKPTFKYRGPNGEQKTGTHTVKTRLVYNREANRFKLYKGDSERVVMNPELLQLMGYDTTSSNWRNDFRLTRKMSLTFKNPPKFDSKMDIMYLYADIVKKSIVGNTQVPLLRIVHLAESISSVRGDDFSTSAHIIFNPPIYSQLEYDRIREINIQLCDNFGQPIAFNGGVSVVTLEFTKW